MKEKKVIDSKVALIDSEGVIHAMGDANEPGSHAIYFIDYIENNYPDVDTGHLTIGSPRNRFGYILGRYGNIIYFNDLESCMIYFPDELTDKQVEIMSNLNLGNQRVAIFYNLEDYGTFIFSEYIGLDDENYVDLKGAMNQYLNIQNRKQQIR